MLNQIESLLENLILLPEFVETQIKELQAESESLPKGSVQPLIINENRYYYHCVNADEKRMHNYIPSDEVAELSGLTQKHHQIKESLKFWRKIKALLSTNFISKCIEMLKELKVLQRKVDKKMQTSMSFLYGEEKQIFLKAFGKDFPKLRGGEAIRLHDSNDILLYASGVPSKYDVGKLETMDDQIKVRSKSELLIVEKLKSRGLEFYYEQAIRLDDRTYYPDFIIRHPVSNEFIIWEHCGRMDDGDYAVKWAKKLYAYAICGVRPGSNLILTYEDSNASFNIKHIQDVINLHFT